MELRYFQKGFNYSQDGPGNRLVYHLQGCNLRCPWCNNPEGMTIEGPLMQIAQFLPEDFCQYGAIKGGQLDRNHCLVCKNRECVNQLRNRFLICPTVKVTVDDLVREISAAASLFFDGGGITLTGGEATLQFNAVKLLLKRVHGMGIHTAIETNATHPRLKELLPFLDLLIADLKHYDDNKHQTMIGLGNVIIRENLRRVVQTSKQLLIRVLLVHGFNDRLEDLEGFIHFFQEIQHLSKEENLQVELLSYHEYSRIKWIQCGLKYDMHDGFVKAARLQQFVDGFKSAGLTVIRT